MKILLILTTLLLASCGTTKYVYVDKVNYKRYQHDQKVRVGMSQKEVMNMFGSPDNVRKTYNYGGERVQFVYYKKIFCRTTTCFVYFKGQRATDFTYFRQEFDNSLVSID